jgi:chromosome segregation ATPase
MGFAEAQSMIEPIMFVGIGFLVASLLVIAVIPLVHARAVRLTMRRLEAVTPMSMAEIQADKDQLRAEFAMSTRRLEMSVEQMKTKTTSQLAEIGKKSDAVGRLKVELGEKTTALFALEAKEKQLADDLQSTAQHLAATTATLGETERTLAQTQAELAKVTADFQDSSMTADSQRVELVALCTQVEVLKGQIESYDKETRDLHERLARDTACAEATGQQLAEERVRTENFGHRVGELERQLVAQTTESEILDRRVRELLARLDEQGRFLAEREYASDVLSQEAASSQKLAADIRAELNETEARRRCALESMRTEKNLIEDQLRQTQDERGKLQREIDTLKREIESTWAAERMENAVLRERINDVAAEVARLTSTLEGPGSPIEAILAGDAGRARPPAPAPGVANGNGQKHNGTLAATGEGARGTLADRIRALQTRSARVPQPSGA